MFTGAFTILAINWKQFKFINRGIDKHIVRIHTVDTIQQ